MLVERLRQQNQRQRKSKVDTALRNIVIKAMEAGPNVKQGHAEGEDRGSFDKDVALALFQGFRRGKLTVERADVDLLDFVFLFLISHKISFPSGMVDVFLTDKVRPELVVPAPASDLLTRGRSDDSVDLNYIAPISL